jgi:hypothetical protein
MRTPKVSQQINPKVSQQIDLRRFWRVNFDCYSSTRKYQILEETHPEAGEFLIPLSG